MVRRDLCDQKSCVSTADIQHAVRREDPNETASTIDQYDDLDTYNTTIIKSYLRW